MTRAARTLSVGLGVACIVGSWPLFAFGYLLPGIAAMLGGFALAQLPFGWRAVASPLSATLVAPLVFWLLMLAFDRSFLPLELILVYYVAGVPIAFMAVAVAGLPLVALLSLWTRPGPLAFVGIGMLSGVLVFVAIPLLAGKPDALLSSEQVSLLAIAGITGAVSGLVFSCVAGIRENREPAA